MNKNDICINVAECTPEHRKEIVTILKGAGENIYPVDRHILSIEMYNPSFPFLCYDIEDKQWSSACVNVGTPLTFDEFKAFFQCEQTEGSIFYYRDWETDRKSVV